MTQRTNDIDRQAAEWAARTDGVECTAELQSALDSWLEQDTRHLGAYLKVKAVMARVERHASVLRQDRAAAVSRRFVRRVVMVGTLAACIAGLAIVFGPTLRQASGETYATNIGQHRTVALTDGSTITMNTDSKVMVRYSSDRRSITLEKGEAIFNVAKNKERPFVVGASGVSIRAIGTRFAVSALPDQPVKVLVVEGIVRVESQSATLVPSLTANTRAIIYSGSAVSVQSVSPQDLAQNLAWRDGHIFFRRQTLASAAREFARYNKTAIVIADPSIGQLTVTGVYVASDPVGFAKAVALSFDLEATSGNGEVRLTRSKH